MGISLIPDAGSTQVPLCTSAGAGKRDSNHSRAAEIDANDIAKDPVVLR
jgi:hypothetical protein